MKSIFKHALVALALVVPGASFAQKISADPTAAALAGGEYLAGVQTGANVKILPSQILSYALANLHSVNAQTGTTYTYVTGDRGKLVSHSNASSIAATLPQATSTFGAGWFVLVQNRGAGTLTITPTTSTIDGASTLVLTTGNGAFILSDGTNYYTVHSTATGGGTVAGSTKQVQYNNAGAFGAEAGFEYDASTDTLSAVNMTSSGLHLTGASTTGSAGFRLPHGSAPTSPTNGDIWTTTAGLYARINGATVGPFGSGGGTPAGSDTYVQYNASGSFGAEAAFAYNASTNLLSVDNITTAGLITTAASTTTSAGLRLPHGAAPTSPVNGDLWTTSAGGLYARINGATIGPFIASTGSALTNFTEALSTATPNGTDTAVSLTATNAASNVDFATIPKGTGSLLAAVPDNTTTGGNKRGTRAVDHQLSRSANTQVASGNNATIAGGLRNTASGVGAVVPGGISNTASNTYAFAVGDTSLASGNTAFAGGSNSTASGNFAVALGSTAVASGSSSVALGDNVTANSNYSVALGYLSTTRGILGTVVYASGNFASAGDAQIRDMVLRSTSTSATPVTLTSNGSAASATNQYVVPNGGAAKLVIDIVARKASSGDYASWTITVLAGQVSGTFAIVGSPAATQDFATAGASAWTLTVSADTTNKAVSVVGTGAASSTIIWVARVRSVEAVG